MLDVLLGSFPARDDYRYTATCAAFVTRPDSRKLMLRVRSLPNRGELVSNVRRVVAWPRGAQRPVSQTTPAAHGRCEYHHPVVLSTTFWRSLST